MPELIAPDTRVHASFLAAMEEFRAEGRGRPGSGSSLDRDLRDYGSTWHDPAVFATYVRGVRAEAERLTFPRTELWYVDGATYLGRLAVRHVLTAEEWELYGHIGYFVRPSARRRGHATAMLRSGLPVAHGLGVDPALITCDTDNDASRRVIEACGGVFEDERGGSLRFRVPTG